MRRQIEASAPAFLLVESAWVGNEGLWRGLIVHNQSLDTNPLRDLVEHCRTKGIPTVFWNKEDPPNFDFFVAAAKLFDVIFTSDADCIPHYREVCGHDRIHAMPFAAQPRIHNPGRSGDWPRYPVCFAGSWKGDAYEERTESITVLLDPAIRRGLHIMDRNLARRDTRPNLRFPERYRDVIKGSLPYPQMLAAYRCYDVMLNANSVTDSPTMFSRRVFESLACGTPVVSMDSVGMRDMLDGHVRVARTAEETEAHLEELLADDEARVREGHLAYRHVHENHTYRHRAEVFLREAGVPVPPTTPPTVSVIVALGDAERLASVAACFERQVYSEKEFVIVVEDGEVEADALGALEGGDVHVVGVDTTTPPGERLDRAVERASGRHVALFDEADMYGGRYLADLMLAAHYASADLLGKATYFVHEQPGDVVALEGEGAEHVYTDGIAASTIVVLRDVARELRFGPTTCDARRDFIGRASANGCRIYSADRFNYLAVRGLPEAHPASRCDSSPGSSPGRRIEPDLSRVMI